MADAGSSYVLGLIVTGMTIYGRTVPGRPVAEAFDDESERIIIRARAAAPDKEGWDEAERVLKGAWTKMADDDLERHRELLDRITDRDWDDLEAEEQREALEQRPSVLTLADVRIFSSGASSAVEVAFLRVSLSHVAAWWLLPSAEDGTASFTHPS